MKSSVKYGIGAALGAIVICVIGFSAHAIMAGSSTSSAESAESSPFKVDHDTIDVPADALEAAGIATSHVQAEDLPVTLTLSGRTGLDMERVAHVHAQFQGKVALGMPQLGDTVKGPDAADGATTLCTIESTDLAQAKSDYLKAKVQLKLDDDNLGRTRQLLESKVLADKFLLDAESAVVKSKADYEAARQKLLVFGLNDKDIEGIPKQQGRQRMAYEITSPRSGVITEKGVAGGELADPTLNLFTVADTSRLWVWGDVYERDRFRVRPGQRMKVILTSKPEEPRECTIDWVSPVLDPTTRSIRIRGSLDNHDGRLLAEMYATLIVTVDDGRGALVVPSRAVVRKGADAYAFVQTSGPGAATRFRRTPVTVEPLDAGPGLTDRSEAAARLRVVRGLNAGDRIVTAGALGLFNEMEQQQKASEK